MHGGLMQLLAYGVSGVRINIKALQEALILYEKYVLVRLCADKVQLDVENELWLPAEMYEIIISNITDEIESMDIYDHNPYNEKLTLKLLDKYKKEYIDDELPENI